MILEVKAKEKKVLGDSPDALRSRTLWRSRAIQSAHGGHLQSRWFAAARFRYIPSVVC